MLHDTFMHAFLASVRGILLLILTLAVGTTASYAQLVAADPDWKESDTPTPPAFDASNASNMARLVPFEVSISSGLRWFVDPATLSVASDGLVRYVVVARSESGITHAFFEAINCGRAEVKTYARQNSQGRANGGWTVVEQPEWRSMYDKLPSKHALALAKQGACDGRAAAQSAADVVRALKP